MRTAARETVAAKAVRLGVPRETLLVWKREGVDIEDDAAVRERMACRRDQGEDESMHAAKLRKLRAEADLRELAVEVERGKYVSRESQLQAGMKAGLLIRQSLLRLASDLPPLLTGLGSAEMAKHLETYARDKLGELSDGFVTLGVAVTGGVGGRDATAAVDGTQRVGRKKRASAKQPTRKQIQSRRRAGAPGDP